MAEIIGGVGGTAYSARVAVDSVKHIKAAKKALQRSFEVQEQKLGFGFVEFLAACPTNWRMTPVQANKRISEEMIPAFPLGVFKDKTARAGAGEES